MQNLNSLERDEVFDLAFRFVTETSENIFLTGKAGTGKTTFLKYLQKNCSKNMVVAAPTGVAAINAGGVTLHSLFQLPFHPFLPTKSHKDELLSKIRFNKQRQQLLRKIELLVIDEISMVRSDTLDAIDTILRSVRRKYEFPFGGVQVLCIGDLHQLPPVAQRQELEILREFYASNFFFDSRVVREQMPLLIELNKIYRQKEDSFVALLSKVRNNNMTEDDFTELHVRYDPSFRPAACENFITLTSHNYQADQINVRELQKLLSPSETYEAIIDNDFPEHSYPAERSLVVKVGAQVMFLKNDSVQKRYFNGKIGVITALKKEEITVSCDGNDIHVVAETWENSHYVLNRADGKLQQETLGTFTQFPLRLAWAITIHKSQGLTFEKVMIDAGAAFSSGQVYVALSRCTSLDGIVLLSKIPAAAIYSNEEVIIGQRALTHKGSLADRFDGARQIFTQQLLEEIFSFKDINELMEVLGAQATEFQSQLNQDGIDWVLQLKDHLATDRNVGLKFISQVATLMKTDPVIERNEALRKRIIAAGNHFLSKFSEYLRLIQNHPMITEHRQAANTINETLNQLAGAVYLAQYCLQYCQQSFSVTTFLRHKLKFALPKFNYSIYASGKMPSNTDIPNIKLYYALKSWRDKICEDSDLPIYMVANRATLTEIATFLPLHKKDLLQITGFGNAKVQNYGDEVLRIVQEYCSAHHIDTNMGTKAAVTKPAQKNKATEPAPDTKMVSYHLYKEGKSIAEIAQIRKVTVATVEGHLGWYIAKGDLNVDQIVPMEKQLLIRAAIKSYGNESVKVLKDHLPESITYGEIRWVLAARMVS